jgi:hypothetical protein
MGVEMLPIDCFRRRGAFWNPYLGRLGSWGCIDEGS